jgi:hypothetical protein
VQHYTGKNLNHTLLFVLWVKLLYLDASRKALSVSFMKTMKILMKIYLKKSKLPSLKIRRLRTIAVETFKIIHKQSPSYLHDLISCSIIPERI